MHHRSLPPEIWVEILRWATASVHESNLLATSYFPFIPAANELLDPVTTVVKKNLVLVCRQWRVLANEFLFESVKIAHGSHALLDALSHHQGSHAKQVRRVVLPYRSTTTSNQGIPSQSLEILKLCTNLETLVRPRSRFSDVLQFHFESESFPLHSLRRLDWFFNTEAERSGGINSLNAVVQAAPNLEYLYVGAAAGYTYVMSNIPVTLPRLNILRLDGNDGLFLRRLSSFWSLPAVTTVIVDNPITHAAIFHIWEAFGPQLKTVEYGKHMKFMLDDYISMCLQACPNLTELNFYLFFTTVQSSNIQVPHTSLATIRLHAAVNKLLQDDEQVCGHIYQLFRFFADDMFPALRQIILYGEWRGLFSHVHLASVWKRLRDQGIEVVPPEGQSLNHVDGYVEL